MNYKTYLTNFGRSIYEGGDLQAAKSAAIKAGFECTIYVDGWVPILTWGPIGGWRGV